MSTSCGHHDELSPLFKKKTSLEGDDQFI
jgi:hypothetical protein